MVLQCPDYVYYIQNFLTVEEENLLLKSVYNVPQTKWTQLSRRRLQNWGGVPHHNGMIPEAIPQWLQTWIEKVAGFQVFSHLPNHVLINEYKPNEGIMVIVEVLGNFLIFTVLEAPLRWTIILIHNSHY